MSDVALNTTTAASVMKVSPTFNMDQINQINGFFDSTAGAIFFTFIWVSFVVGMIAFSVWIICKNERDANNNGMDHDYESNGVMLRNGGVGPVVEIELPTINTNESDADGKYHRMF
ncbi:unnamed protein product [Caenorhabditis nigoni]|uniref:Uncharacterized protein n=1 Tax=Caenorhabditis nigoni TaxID=1611254 RepID=A0A2G5SZM9_9PELO|nr:hypothetical protein B9Z55_025629 [Caenorhabditis nigoni]